MNPIGKSSETEKPAASTGTAGTPAASEQPSGGTILEKILRSDTSVPTSTSNKRFCALCDGRDPRRPYNHVGQIIDIEDGAVIPDDSFRWICAFHAEILLDALEKQLPGGYVIDRILMDAADARDRG
jgi:hypothetical protein